jgi:hypothetical protein
MSIYNIDLICANKYVKFGSQTIGFRLSNRIIYEDAVTKALNWNEVMLKTYLGCYET